MCSVYLNHICLYFLPPKPLPIYHASLSMSAYLFYTLLSPINATKMCMAMDSPTVA